MEGNGFSPRSFLSDVFGNHSTDTRDVDSFDGKGIRINVQIYYMLLNGLCRLGGVEKAG